MIFFKAGLGAEEGITFKQELAGLLRELCGKSKHINHRGSITCPAISKYNGTMPVDYSSLDDGKLIVLIADSDSNALSELYDRYKRLVFSLALRIVGDQAASEEITQDVFFRIWNKAETYQPEQAKVSTWLTSIARYRSIDLLRRRGVRPESNSVSWPELSHSAIPGTDGREPEENASRSLQGERVRTALDQLPSEQRQALSLAYYQGFSHSQIAEELDIPLGTIKTRIRLGMQKLRQILQEEQSV
jgi:RNA polymerase sigma-70 factor (ECF subfamily)